MVTVHSSVCVMPVHTKFRLVSGNPPYWAVDTHVYLFSDRNYGSYSDLPSGLPTAEICILQSLDIRSTENPSNRMATSRFFAINVTAIAIIHHTFPKCKHFLKKFYK